MTTRSTPVSTITQRGFANTTDGGMGRGGWHERQTSHRARNNTTHRPQKSTQSAHKRLPPTGAYQECPTPCPTDGPAKDAPQSTAQHNTRQPGQHNHTRGFANSVGGGDWAGGAAQGTHHPQSTTQHSTLSPIGDTSTWQAIAPT